MTQNELAQRRMLEPLQVGNVRLKNRVVMGSMHTGLEDSLSHLGALTRYFCERAEGDVGLIITGGYSPNHLGKLNPFGASFNKKMADAHRTLTQAVQQRGSKIALQILHAGRYAYHPLLVAPSRIRAPINRFTPWAMPDWLVRSTVQDFVSTAVRAQAAGYDGVEIMGSEGYLVHQFFSARTNHRTDAWGGSLEHRMRFGVEIVKQIRQATRPDFLVIFRISLLDLVEGGASPEETLAYARALEKAGVSIFNSGIGWHEARIPTIGSMVPPAAFTSMSKKLKDAVQAPVIAVNRMNHPEVIESVLASGHADLISMARPLLADPHFVKKVRLGQQESINPCIACNQACLDHIFNMQMASCLVNPAACEEANWPSVPAIEQGKRESRVAVIGAGPAGMNAAIESLRLGHSVTLFEKSRTLGGQFRLAALIPGKEEYNRSIEYWSSEFQRLGGILKTGISVQSVDQVRGFDHVVLASGVVPRPISIPGSDLPNVFLYDDFIQKLSKNEIQIADSVAIIGSGGIGVDVATQILHHGSHIHDQASFFKNWGINPDLPGGIIPGFRPPKSHLKITLLQRSSGGIGRGLGKTTGWIHRLELKRKGVQSVSGLSYERITPEGVWIRKNSSSTPTLIPGQQVVVCAGQLSQNQLVAALKSEGIPHSVIGGARLAGELDAKRAIREAWQFARELTSPRAVKSPSSKV